MTRPSAEDKALQIQQLREAGAAQVALGRFVFPVVRKSKKPFFGTHGHLDAQNNLHALTRKWDEGQLANVGINLIRSNLTVLDIDSGLTDLQHALEWAKLKNIDQTFMVVSGRETFGIHFYFSGTRKNGRFQDGEVKGDIKCNGFCVSPGSIHNSGRTYTPVNQLVPAPLPEWLRDYDTKAKAETSEVELSRPNEELEYDEEYATQKVFAGRRHWFLLKQAGWFRDRGCERDTIISALKDLCINRCADGEDYLTQNERSIHDMANEVCKQPIGRARAHKAPRPRPELEQYLEELCPLGVTMNKSDVIATVTNEGFYFPGNSRDRMAILRAIRSLNIKTWKQGGKTFWLREEAPEHRVEGEEGRTPIASSCDAQQTSHIAHVCNVTPQMSLADI